MVSATFQYLHIDNQTPFKSNPDIEKISHILFY